MTIQDLAPSRLFQWLSINEPTITQEDTQIVACAGDFVVTLHGNTVFAGWVTDVYEDSFETAWLEVEFYGDKWHVTDEAVLQIVR
jgi:hypothetical protein